MFNAQCSTNSRFVSVALPLPIGRRNELIYRVPDTLLPRVQAGVRVVVPVSNRKITGIIVGRSSHPGDVHFQKVKDILDIIDEVPIFPQDMKNIWEWMAHYYFSASGAVLQTILPRTVRHQSTVSVTLPKKKRRRKNGGHRGRRPEEAVPCWPFESGREGTAGIRHTKEKGEP